MNKLYKSVIKNWKTSVTGLFLAVFTLMFFLEKIDTTDYIAALGAVGTIVALLAKDGDKDEIE